jgi:FlaA1/EpsC-like NDP-sugar epimerase
MNSTAASQNSTTAQLPAQGRGLRGYLLALSRMQKRALQLAADTLLIWACLWLAFYLRLGSIESTTRFMHDWLFILAPVITLPIFVRFGLYRAVVHCLGYQALTSLTLAITASAILLMCAVYLFAPPPDIVPRSIVFIYWMLCLIFIGGLRVAMRQYFGHAFTFRPDIQSLLPGRNRHPRQQTRVAIFGAGAAGNQLLDALRQSGRCQIVAFIDDDPQITGRVVAGVIVYASSDLARLMKNAGPQEVLLAIPSAARGRRVEIVDMLAPYPVHVRTVPGLMDLASGRVKTTDLREINITDVLGRDPVQPDAQLFQRCIRSQVIMVTGAGGSIGSELCRQIMDNGPTTLILFEQCEFNLYCIHSELEARVRKAGLDTLLVPILGSVQDQKRTFDAMTMWKVDTVYHAAAYKHVPMVERNIAEGITNNVFGTLQCAQSAVRAGVRNFVLISTDKAVRPTNIMGGSKRLSEMVLQALARESAPVLYGRSAERAPVNRTRFTMVRFGNVLGSSGSVIPLFTRQISTGGPITVTHPEITRYFMTIPEAAQLVIQAGAMGQGGDVFVLDMGAPVKIAQLAEKMISLSGLTVRSPHNPEGDIAIEFVGLRPGEKLYEELLIGDNVTATEHPMIMRASEAYLEWARLKIALTAISDALQRNDYPRICELFRQLVDGYPAKSVLVDWVHLRRPAARNQARAPGLARPEIRRLPRGHPNTRPNTFNPRPTHRFMKTSVL